MYCSKCGKEIMDEAVVCPGCGCAIKNDVLPHAVEIRKNNTQVSLILGIVGIIFAWLFALVGHIASIIGIIMGIKEYKETGKMTGLVVSIIGEVCAIFSSIIGAVTMASVF